VGDLPTFRSDAPPPVLPQKEREIDNTLCEIITKFVPFVVASQKILILTFMTLTTSNSRSSLAEPIAATMNLGLMTAVCC